MATLNDTTGEVIYVPPSGELEILLLDSHGSQKEEVKIMELKTNWEKTAEHKGIIQGKLEGKLEEGRRILSKFIKAQFGELNTGDAGANLLFE